MTDTNLAVRTRSRALIASAPLLALALLCPRPVAAGEYGAIAYSPATGNYGYSFQYDSQDAAERAALRKCAEDDAVLAGWVRDGWCALAVEPGSGTAYGWAWADDADGAKARALAACRKRAAKCYVCVCVSSCGEVETFDPPDDDGPQPSTTGEATETRKQAVLRITGAADPEAGGFVINGVEPDGPAARLRDRNDAALALRPGDVITRVEGKAFTERSELLDLLNEAYARGDGVVRITVRRKAGGETSAWARPALVEMEVPARKRFDFLAELGTPVPAAPAPPVVPAVIDP
jgi:hypothetical protein